MGQLNRTCRMNARCFLSTDASRQLQSSGKLTCLATDPTWLGDGSFGVAGPRLWSMLSASLHLVDNFACFKPLLKAHLFTWGCGAWCRPTNVLLIFPYTILRLLGGGVLGTAAAAGPKPARHLSEFNVLVVLCNIPHFVRACREWPEIKIFSLNNFITRHWNKK